MDERIDIWDESGVPTGTTAMKSEAHRDALWHPTVHIWFYTASGKVLLQRRAEDKDTYPGLWDVSVAGHIGAGESPTLGALREIAEEIGLQVDEGALDFIMVHRESRDHPGGIRDREFRHIYLCELQSPLKDLKPQESEVAELKLMPLLQWAEEVWGLARPGPYVPHGAEYYGKVIKEIRSRL